MYLDNKNFKSEIEFLDFKINRINQKLQDDKNKNERRKNKLIESYQKFLLEEDNIEHLNHLINGVECNLSEFMPTLFKDVVDKVFKESDNIRPDLLKTIESIITRSDFSIFASDENIKGFGELYSIKDKNIVIEAYIAYLTEGQNVKRQVLEALKGNNYKHIYARINYFCNITLDSTPTLEPYFKEKEFVKI